MPAASTRVLVGRDGELATLCGLVGLDGTGGTGPDGTGGGVLLAGDAGVGKTRLLTELCGRATDAGRHVLVGHCLDFGGDWLPYLPFTEAFGRLAATPGAGAQAVAEAGPALAPLLPGRPPAAGQVSRAELFQAVEALLGRLARDAPVLLVVEDVHWADPSTRELLGLLLARATGARVSLVASYRADDLHRRHPLRAQAAQWSRLPGVTRLGLPSLPDEDVRALVRELQPTGLSDEDVDRIVARAGGNAFFTEELVSAVRRGERSLTADLADLLLLHLDALDEDARRVVRVVAVAGGRISHDQLAAVTGLGGAALDEALRAAVDRHVLVAADGPGDGYAFRHALLAEAVYDDLLPGERVRLHRVFADLLRTADAGTPGGAAQLARHARAARDVPTAISAGVRAGDEAMRVGGPAEASAAYEQVLELLAEPGAGGTGVDVVSLVLRAAESAVAAGRLHRALDLVRHQLQALPADADPLTRVLLLRATASTALLDDAPIDTLALSAEALRLLPAGAPGPLRAQVLAVRARACAAHRHREEALRRAAEAIDLARELDLPDVLADATTTYARLTQHPAPQEAEQALRAGLADARAGGDAAVELRSMHQLGSFLYETGRLAEAQEAYAAAAARAVELRRPWAPYGFDGRVMAALVASTRGDLDGALRILDTSAESPPPLARAALDTVRLGVAATRGDTAALELLPRLRPWWERDGMLAVLCGGAAVDLHGDAGDLAAATAVHDEVVARATALWGNPTFQARVRLGALLTAHLGTAAARAPGRERRELLERGQRLVEAARAAVEAASAYGPETAAWLARAEAEHLRLRLLAGAGDPGVQDPAAHVAAWTRAVAAAEAFGGVHETARARARLAAALRAAGDTAGAEREVVRATGTARALGAAPLLRELRGIALGPSRAGEPDQLTAREREVLVLVADGRSNSEVARALSISAKTVSVHVSNILAKLGAAGRTEAAALARRRGLLPD
ncbi:helix-turn-helix transcriptional regulator [Kineococcus sp. NUM-3379]